MPGFELFGEEERTQVNEVLNTGVLMRYGFDGMRQGQWKAKSLEKALEERFKVKHAHLVSSGTAALTVALASMGIGAGDEVIMPVFTFVASFEAIMALGAIPVPVDIDDTLTLDLQGVENAITNNTKVVMPVHMCGSMARLKELKAICDKYNLLLLEDACQAIGGTYEGKPLGSYGDAGCFSFDYVKTITCGEGGALITNHTDCYENAHKFSDHGHDHIGMDRGAESHPFLGYNYRISELNAAVGLAQVHKLDTFLKIQKKNYQIIRAQIESLEKIQFRTVPLEGEESYAFLTIFLPNATTAQSAMKSLKANGVDGCFYWYDNNWHYINQWKHLTSLRSLGKLPNELKIQFEKHMNRDFSKSDFWMRRTISILIKLSWTEEETKARAQKIYASLKSVI
ncbi:DegT/DnrJ/EryC1/StrS family aminotransferase [Ascidiimonas sp. W6]|uniref:DegT/DnrJ/EryC1/StrS family aminotransferase n=1 Tax=Ascidiimonas meishanensis TaxID=3128903 RepID=UPI0030EEC9AE